ncbi:uncharacterized protein TNCV_3140061 [Trichonephila clavipes]|nr:uncharacterized protein TNCV_3140061 [Trichonephila clavipes]
MVRPIAVMPLNRMENTTFAMATIVDSPDMGLRTVLQSRRQKKNAYSTYVHFPLAQLGPWIAYGLDHRTPGRKTWVRFPMPPNTFRVHTEYMLVKSVGPKVLWAVAAETTSAGGWRIFPSPPVPRLNCGGGDRWCRYLS